MTISKKMLNVTVKRNRWIRGECASSSLFRGNDKKMCCLGFAARACGYKIDDIRDRMAPDGVRNRDKFLEKTNLISSYSRNSKICNVLIKTNDYYEMKDSLREKELKKLGKLANIHFKFVD